MSSDRFFIKEEYIKQLINVFEKPIYDIIIKTFEESKLEYIEESKKEQVDLLEIFQKRLLEIRDWNSDKIQTVYRSIRKDDISSETETFINDLVEQVIKSEIAFLLQQNNPEFKIKIPSNALIFFRSLKGTVTRVYETPFIVNTADISDNQRYQYNNTIKELIELGIRNTIQTCTINDIFFKELKKIDSADLNSDLESQLSQGSQEKSSKQMGELEKFQETLKSLPVTREPSPVQKEEEEEKEDLQDYFDFPKAPENEGVPIKVNLPN